MPTLTFYNLKEEKQKKITVAIENELDRVPLEKISINKIIMDASIPRGSFYQYFKDVEDAVQYVVEKYIEDEKRAIKEILSKNNNDIFKDTLELYDYLVDKYYNLKEVRLYANIFAFLHQKNYPLRNSGERSQEEINKMFELDYLNIRTKEDIEVIAKILVGSTPFSTKLAILVVNTLVFPLPAPAITSKGPSINSTASFCSLFNKSKFIVHFLLIL